VSYNEVVSYEYLVTLDWDDEAEVWVATSEDVEGLVLESGSADALIERLRTAVPELLAMNGQKLDNARVQVVTNRVLVAA